MITYFTNSSRESNKTLFGILTILMGLFCCFDASAREYWVAGPLDTVPEKKVDYLEKIYFSGENKAGINANILATLQELEGKLPTPALAKQVTFLLEIKNQATAAANACDILDMLAVGIYNIDAAEAKKQGVKMPSDKAKADAGEALASLNKLSNNTNNLSNTTRNLAWSNYLITGKTKGFGTASTLGNASNIIGGASALGETGRQLGDFGKTIFKKKDKSCNDVARKEIQLGNMLQTRQVNVATNVKTTTGGPEAGPMATAPATGSMTIINISGADYSKLARIQERIKNCSSVSASKMKYDINGSSINVAHAGSVEDLLTVMLSACKDILSSKNVVGMSEEERKISLKL